MGLPMNSWATSRHHFGRFFRKPVLVATLGPGELQRSCTCCRAWDTACSGHHSVFFFLVVLVLVLVLLFCSQVSSVTLSMRQTCINLGIRRFNRDLRGGGQGWVCLKMKFAAPTSCWHARFCVWLPFKSRWLSKRTKVCSLDLHGNARL